jgi:hypothetical protein
MRLWTLFLPFVFLAVVVPVFAVAAPNEDAKSTQERLQGKWSRPHGWSCYLSIVGNEITQYTNDAPLVPFRKGILRFDRTKNLAFAKMNDGWTMWLWLSGAAPTGEDVLALEHFGPDGKLFESGAVLYKAK